MSAPDRIGQLARAQRTGQLVGALEAASAALDLARRHRDLLGDLDARALDVAIGSLGGIAQRMHR